MEPEYVNAMAQEVVKVLKCTPTLLMSWGASVFKAIVYNNKAALQFQVQGFIHKGVVIVAYNEGDDLYEVYCLNKQKQVINSQTQVYFDSLSQTIDEMVEKNGSDELYNNKVQNWLNETNQI